MKRIVLFILCFQLSAPAQTFANGPGAFAALRDLDDYLTEIKEEEEANEPQNNDELDEEGQKTLVELQAWAEQNPEEFAAMLASEDADYSDEEEPQTLDALGAYCPDPNAPAYVWEAATKKKKKKKGPRCTAAALKTNISTCCLLFVRTKLGLPSNPKSAHARDYGPVLTRNGYCTIKTSARNAPVGAVLVYSGGASGHIELKRGPSSYWWGPTNSVPATEWKSKKRTLKGVYVKCKGKK